MSPDKMTCWSCEHYRIGHCALSLPLYPSGGPGWCDGFEYEMGSDEQERDQCQS